MQIVLKWVFPRFLQDALGLLRVVYSPVFFQFQITGSSCAIYGANLVKSGIQPSFVLLCPYVCFCKLLSTPMTSPIRKKVC